MKKSEFFVGVVVVEVRGRGRLRDGLVDGKEKRKKNHSSLFSFSPSQRTFQSVASIASFRSLRESGAAADGAAASEVEGGGGADDIKRPMHSFFFDEGMRSIEQAKKKKSVPFLPSRFARGLSLASFLWILKVPAEKTTLKCLEHESRLCRCKKW